ncbi:tetratricopeptide repeat protein [Methylotenera versatilis]|uniref:TPR repeat-containing protein n=1 Tax=Methylotenera versatilis (strain 301) TaxID=666681 RepID=D7DHW5_METV0|nr:tetratricopeptide repeat protein [Methylotenera versatilis]ADI29650.1 TPR repeat-containing protein [Methylotenera versatilis 301]
MSLINQMLKDLEQRGAGSNDAKEMIISSPSEALQPAVITPYTSQHYQAKHGVPFLKISGLMVLLAGGAYLWVQSAPALSHSIDQLKVQATPQAVLMHADSEAATKPAEDTRTIAAVQTTDSASPPLFESTLRYTPIAAQTNKLEKYPQKDKVIANVMPAELLASSPANTNQATKPVEPVSSQPVEPANNVVVSGNSVVPTKLVVAAKSPAHSSNSSILKQISPEQKSGNSYRQALANLQQGRVAEAQSNLAQALEANPANQEARQTLAGLLLDNNRNDEARATLAAGLAIAPEQTNFRMALARLQIELGDKSAALTTMEQGQAYANNNADYQSFLATLLQRANRHDEAISHYKTALSMNASPNNSSSANSLVGLGISLQATGKLENAQEAFTRAQSVATLSPELAQFIDQQLKQINQRLQNSASK